jgi:transposase
MVPGGAPKHLKAAKAAKMLRSVRPASVETERREVAKQLLEDWRWCNRRIPTVEARLHEALEAHGSTLTGIFGVGDVGAETILAIVGDVGRFRSAGHFTAYNGTAPIEASSGGPQAAPAQPGRQPPTQRRDPHRRSHPDPPRHRRPDLLPAQGART